MNLYYQWSKKPHFSKISIPIFNKSNHILFKNNSFSTFERTSSVTFERRKTGIAQLYKNLMISLL